jgi:vacuolar-type H+-ATPase subunit I/STV1
MFGDIGHALIMLGAAVALICFEDKLQAKNIKDEVY